MTTTTTTATMSSSSGAVSYSSARGKERSGSTLLSKGIIHLFKELGARDEDDASEKQAGGNGDVIGDGTVVAVVSVPGNLEVAHFLRFIQPALESVVQLRMLKYVPTLHVHEHCAVAK